MYNIFLIVLLTAIIAIQAEENVLVKDLKFTLPRGDRIPVIGFGTFGLKGTEIKQILDDALSAGYRLFDTATVYRNEEDIGIALKELLPKRNLTRSDIFITSKLATHADTYAEHAYKELQGSLDRLDAGYIDLYLIHSPSFSPAPREHFNFSQARDESWKQLARGQKEGLVRNIGVSNYNVRHLKEVLNNDHGVKPALNQVEWHPEYHQDDLMDLCKKEGIALQAYFSLGGNRQKNRLLENQEVKKIAAKLGKTPSQVLLRWAVQQNVLVIPKSRSRKHQEENIDLNFEIPQLDIKILNDIKQAEKYASRNNPDLFI